MISVRNLILGIVLGAITAVLVRDIHLFGLAVAQWRFTGRGPGEALITGALVGVISQMFGQQSKGRR